MRSFGVVALLVLGGLLAFAGRARAVSEFCPAEVDPWQAVNVVSSTPLEQTGPSLVYGIRLSALSTRTLNARIAIQTDVGWFESSFANVKFERTIESPGFNAAPIYVVRFYSPEVYVRFPSDVRVVRMWVGSATVFDDGGFGWTGKGRIDCDAHPSEMISPDTSAHGSVIDPDFAKAVAALRAAPQANSQVVPAIATSAPAGLFCARPFADASVTNAVYPDFPQAARESTDYPRHTVEVAVAIDATGQVVDIWPWSHFAQPDLETGSLETAAVEAARKSTYAPAVALCKNAAGVYIFRADFAVGP